MAQSLNILKGTEKAAAFRQIHHQMGLKITRYLSLMFGQRGTVVMGRHLGLPLQY